MLTYPVAIPVPARPVRGYQDTGTALIVSVGDMSVHERIPDLRCLGRLGPLVAKNFRSFKEPSRRLKPEGKKRHTQIGCPAIMSRMGGNIGLRRGTVALAKYDPWWPQEFEREKRKLQQLLQAAVIDIQHVGSTSVPNLAAKPIIDVMVGIRSLSGVTRLRGKLERTGYEYRANGSDNTQVLFAKGAEERRTHYIHITEYRGSFWNDHLLFRDYMRGNPDEAGLYEQSKRVLAAQHATDREGYTAGKRAYIDIVVAKAKQSAVPDYFSTIVS